MSEPARQHLLQPLKESENGGTTRSAGARHWSPSRWVSNGRLPTGRHCLRPVSRAGIDTPVRNRFHASLDQVDLAGDRQLFEADTQLVRRTSAKIARMRVPMFVLMQLRVGEVRFRQLGCDVRIGPGECVFVDGTEPYELECLSLTKAVALRLPPTG